MPNVGGFEWVIVLVCGSALVVSLVVGLVVLLSRKK